MKCPLSIHLCRMQHPIRVRRQRLSIRARIMDRPALTLDRHFQLRRRQRHRLLIPAHAKIRAPPALHNHAIPRPLRRPLIERRIGHVQHIRRVHFDPQHPRLLPHLQSLALLLKTHHRVWRIPLCPTRHAAKQHSQYPKKDPRPTPSFHRSASFARLNRKTNQSTLSRIPSAARQRVTLPRE